LYQTGGFQGANVMMPFKLAPTDSCCQGNENVATFLTIQKCGSYRRQISESCNKRGVFGVGHLVSVTMSFKHAVRTKIFAFCHRILYFGRLSSWPLVYCKFPSELNPSTGNKMRQNWWRDCLFKL